MAGKRLDNILFESGLAPSREKARALIMAGNVLVNDVPVTKAGAQVQPDAEIRLRGKTSKFVSRGGDKLAGALDVFGIDPAGLNTIDIGASTGGFSHCLLERGAATVCCVDVGYGQLDPLLRNDPRVTVFEKTNARYLTPEKFDTLFDLMVVDVSFISLLKVIPALIILLKDNASILALVKPQFEAGPQRVGKGGVVRKASTHEEILNEVIEGIRKLGANVEAATHSKVKGPKGNIEFFVHISKANQPSSDTKINVKEIITAAHQEMN